MDTSAVSDDIGEKVYRRLVRSSPEQMREIYYAWRKDNWDTRGWSDVLEENGWSWKDWLKYCNSLNQNL